MDNVNSAPLRICVFGAAPQADWLEKLRVANGVVEILASRNVADALRSARTTFPGDSLVLVQTDTALPPFWLPRLVRALDLPDVLVASPLDNADVERSPLQRGADSAAPPALIDALCYRHGTRDVVQWASFSRLLSAWHGEALRTFDIDRLRDTSVPANAAPWRAVLVSDLYVADENLPLRGPRSPQPRETTPPHSALGELREHIARALNDPANETLPGLDGKPVVLHVLHAWGGGSERFVRDLASADPDRHHLVLSAAGDFARRRFGERLLLLDGTMKTPLRQTELSDPIASTRLSHRAYADFLTRIIREFSVDAVFVSSLIGHSLDALRTGLPTVFFVHDFYPLWPLLHRNLDDPTITFDDELLAADLANTGPEFEFAERDPTFWIALRRQLTDALIETRATLASPSRSALHLFCSLQPRLNALASHVVPHGTAAWTTSAPLPLSPPPVRPKLRLIVLGRMRKMLPLLRQLVPRLNGNAELFLIGAGIDAQEFFGVSGVHVLLNYRHDELPALMARLAPDAALIVPSFAETFSYILSELTSLGIPTIATRFGALAERIVDRSTGFLVPPEATVIAELIGQLDAHRDTLADVRRELGRIPHRSLSDMVRDYGGLLPDRHHYRDAIGEADLNGIAVQMRADELGRQRRHNAILQRTLDAQTKELHRRGEWGFELNAQLRHAHAATRVVQSEMDALHAEFDQRTAWALKLDAELAETRAGANAERERFLTSASWRLTKPLRYAARKLRGARTRLRYAVNRLRAILHRTRGSLASRGLAGTLKRAADEFRRGPAPDTVSLVSAPTDDFAPFVVPTSAQPRVSIVIPVFNKMAYTAACLRSLAEHADDIAFETIVVDDGSTDQTSKRLPQIDGVRVVRNPMNLGFVGSCNAGAALAAGEFVVFLNNDTVVTAGWLHALLHCFEQEADAGLVGAKLVYPDGRLQEAGGIVFSDGSGWNYGRFDDPADPRYSFRRQADYCSGAAIMLRRELFEQLDGFDLRYAPAYYEDTDLAFAVRAAGKKVFVEPRSLVVHFEGVTAGTDTSSGMKRFQMVNRTKFVEKWKTQLMEQPAPIHEAKLAPRAANWRDRGHVLIVDAYTPTPDQDSGSLRMLNVMQVLREMGFAVSFLPDNRAHAGDYTRALQDLGVQALYHPFVTDPIAWLRENGPQLSAVILSRHYVAANYMESVRLYAPRARLIFDTVDVHHLREQRAAELQASAELAQQARRTRAQEMKLMRDSDVTLVVSATEKEILLRDLPKVRIEIVSNVHAVYGRRKDFESRRDLVFVGGFQHPPNIDAVLWFVNEVFPLVRAKLTDVVLHVIGSKATPAILHLAHDGVTVHGFVPDIAPFMDGCRLSLAPLRYGAGVKGKVNMAMSYGLPVVATTPAVEGMHVRADEDVLVADSPVDFAAAVVRGYTDAALWHRLSDNGLANVRKHFSFDAAHTAIASILADRL